MSYWRYLGIIFAAFSVGIFLIEWAFMRAMASSDILTVFLLSAILLILFAIFCVLMDIVGRP